MAYESGTPSIINNFVKKNDIDRNDSLRLVVHYKDKTEVVKTWSSESAKRNTFGNEVISTAQDDCNTRSDVLNESIDYYIEIVDLGSNAEPKARKLFKRIGKSNFQSQTDIQEVSIENQMSMSESSSTSVEKINTMMFLQIMRQNQELHNTTLNLVHTVSAPLREIIDQMNDRVDKLQNENRELYDKLYELKKQELEVDEQNNKIKDRLIVMMEQVAPGVIGQLMSSMMDVGGKSN